MSRKIQWIWGRGEPVADHEKSGILLRDVAQFPAAFRGKPVAILMTYEYAAELTRQLQRLLTEAP